MPDDAASAGSGSESSATGLRVFINYRRDDTPGHAGRLYDALATRFGEDNVFIDVDKIDPGADFTRAIEREVGSCDVLIAMIGRQWLTGTDSQGRRRLDNPEDYVRLEIKAALDRDVTVIPMLVQGVSMPTSQELPPALADLARRNSIEMGEGARWRHDVERLTDAMERMQAAKAPPAAPAGGRSDDGTPDGGATGPGEPAEADATYADGRRERGRPGVSRWRGRRWFVGAAALSIAAAVGAVVFLVTRGSDRASEASMNSGMNRSFPDAIEDELLLAHIPRNIRSTCKRIPIAEPSVFLRSVRCSQGHPGEYVTYDRSHSGEAIRADFLQRVNSVGIAFPTKAHCTNQRPAAGEWIRERLQVHVEGASRRAEGRVLCYENSQTSWIVWTDTPTKILAIASRPTNDWRSLYTWWRASAGPEKELSMAGRMDAMNKRPYPDSIERELLLMHIPASIGDTCRRSQDFDRNVFLRSVTCAQAAREGTVTYSYAHSGTALRAFSTDRITAAGLDFPTPQSCARAGFAADVWVRRGAIGHVEQRSRAANGRVLCYEPEGMATIEWTDTPTGIYASASRPAAKRAALYKWWQSQAGPGTLEMTSGTNGAMGS